MRRTLAAQQRLLLGPICPSDVCATSAPAGPEQVVCRQAVRGTPAALCSGAVLVRGRPTGGGQAGWACGAGAWPHAATAAAARP